MKIKQAQVSSELAILDWIESNATKHPNAPAILNISGSTILNYAEMFERVSALAHEFHEHGIGRDTKVAVSMMDGPITLTILLALMSISAVIPIHPISAATTIADLVDQLDISVVVGAHRPASAAWQVAETKVLCYIEVENDPSRKTGVQLRSNRTVAEPSRERARLDDVALYLRTSGTTGNSAVVSITQRSLDRNVSTHGALKNYGPADRALCVMNFTFVFAFVRASLPILRFGGSVIVAPSYRFADIKQFCKSLKPTCMAATPAIIQKLISDSEDGLWRPQPGVLKKFHATGEAIPETLRARLSEVFGASLSTNYGMTEVSPQVAHYGPDDQFDASAVGEIVSPWLVDIVSDTGSTLPRGGVGRIALRGGYVNEVVGRDKEARFDQEGRLLTGDRGFIDQDDILFVTGRVDEVINRGGEKIDPKVIEESIESDVDVERAVVFGVPDPKLGHKIIAMCVLRKDATRTAQNIRESIGAKITGWGMPEQIILVPEIPTNSNGKVSRRDLSLRYADE